MSEETEGVAQEEQFRRVMGRFATGVSVVTAAGSDGEPHGFTANAVTSVSLDPLLVLICIDRGSLSLSALLESGCFGVSFLRVGQEKLARRFAGGERDQRFRGLSTFRGDTGSPILADALGWLDCTLWKTVEAGDHVVVFGRVRDTGVGPEGNPLVFYEGRYRTVTS